MRTLLILLFFAALVFASPQSLKTYQLSPDKYRVAVEYNHLLYVLDFLGVAWDALVLAAIIHWRVARRVQGRLGNRIVLIALLLAVPWAAQLPLTIYRHALSLRYGISIETWWPWFQDLFKAASISGAAGVLAVVAAYSLIRRLPRYWWVVAWLLSVVLIVAGTYAAPLVFDPLFFHFRPLASSNRGLAEALQRLAARAGFQISTDHILVMDASEKTRGVNAYMTGFGPSRQIVIWDTTLNVLTDPQVETVFAHELGHYALNHIPRGIGTSAIALLLVFWLAHRVTQAKRFAVSDVGNLPRVLLILLLLGFAAEPVVNGCSRWMEHQADIYELNAMCGAVPNAGLNSAEVDQIMAEIDLEDPNPGWLIQFWLYSHPPNSERMIFAQEYWASAGCK